MGDYSGMPPLVDQPQAPAGAGSPQGGYSGFPGTPYMNFPPAPPTPGWPNNNFAGWGAPQASYSPQWPPPTMASWPPAGGIRTPGANPASLNPAMSAGPDVWPRPGDDADNHNASGYFGKLGKQDDGGWVSVRSPSSRPITPFSQSNTSSPASTTSGISRSRSMRSSIGGENRKRPPREWRPDFSMSRSLGFGALGSLLTKARSASISGSIMDTSKHPKLHPYLRYSITSPPMHYDLRYNPSTLRFRDLDRSVNTWDLTRFACEPPEPHMRLYNSHYPWYIDAESTNPTGVTLHELFSAIYLSMMTPISQADYWNNEMDGEVRERIARAWSERCENDEERQKGVKRVDFLMGRLFLEGIVRGKEGMWEMKIKKL